MCQRKDFCKSVHNISSSCDGDGCLTWVKCRNKGDPFFFHFANGTTGRGGRECKSANGKTVIVPRSHSPAFPSLRRRMGKRCRCCRNVVPNYNFSVEGHQPERFSEGPPYFNKGTTGPRSAARFKPEEHPRSKLLKYSEQEEEKEQQLK